VYRPIHGALLVGGVNGPPYQGSLQTGRKSQVEIRGNFGERPKSFDENDGRPEWIRTIDLFRVNSLNGLRSTDTLAEVTP
jgi:hypothetical protein